MKRVLLIAALFANAPLYAQQTGTDHAAPVKSQVQGVLVEGEVRKVDLETKKITLRHGPIPNLDMPPMSMVFQVRDAALLEKVKTGDKVRFTAEKIGGAYTVTSLEAAK